MHTAPAFGADDNRVGKKYGIGILTLVDRQGKFIDNVGEFSGRYVKDYKNDKDYKDVDVDIAVKLKRKTAPSASRSMSTPIPTAGGQTSPYYIIPSMPGSSALRR